MLLLLFHINDQKYGLDTEHVVEVIPILEFLPIPETPSYVLGSFEYRGKIVPVIDLTQLAIERPSSIKLSTRLVLIKLKGHIVGLTAEKMTDMVEVKEDEIEKEPTTSESPCLGSFIKTEQGSIQIINLEKLIPEHLQKQLFN